MTKREDQMRERIYSLEGQLVKAAIMITEARERAEAAEKRVKDQQSAWKDSEERLINRIEAAEKRVKELALALDAALMGWESAPPTDQDDYDSIAELRAALEAKP